jgi:hypothetical protein
MQTLHAENVGHVECSVAIHSVGGIVLPFAIYELFLFIQVLRFGYRFRVLLLFVLLNFSNQLIKQLFNLLICN